MLRKFWSELRLMWVEWLLILALVALIVLAISMKVWHHQAEVRCLAHGWPRMEVAGFFKAYCVTYQDGREIVVPLSEILAE